MNLQMKAIRMRLDLSQKEAAALVEMPVRRYGSYEREERGLTLEDACIVADAFRCTLDELAGRKWPIESGGSLTTDEQVLMETYRGLDRERQDRLLDVAQDMEAASDRGSPPEAIDAEAG